MPPRIESQIYATAVLDYVQTGAYPNSEEIISAELPASALPDALNLIAKAREDVKTTIGSISRECAPDVDGWISQAKQLREDIHQSQQHAKEIVDEAKEWELLEEQVNDAANKVALLDGELAFTRGLSTTLERLQTLRQKLDSIQRAIIDDQLIEAVEKLQQAERDVASLPVSHTARVMGVIGTRLAELLEEVGEKVRRRWDELISVDLDAQRITIQDSTNRETSNSSQLSSTVYALKSLGLFDKVLSALSRGFETLILNPRLEIRSDGKVASFEMDGGMIRRTKASSDLSAQALFADLDAFIDFVLTRLPTSVVVPLSVELMPQLTSKVISVWLASAVPDNLNGMDDFQHTIGIVQKFASALKDKDWPDHRALTQWINDIPRIWLKKRQDSSLHQVRRLLARGLGPTEAVERIETQKLARDDDVFSGPGGGDDWNAGWSDGEAEASPVKVSRLEAKPTDDEEEDVSAWGLDADDEDRKPVETTEDDAESWGWGEDNVGEEPVKASPLVNATSKKSKENGVPAVAGMAEREITLKEMINLSSLPREILDIISLLISDASLLETSEHAECPVASAGTPLLSLPGLIVAMYRACASVTYASHPNGSMFLYNDSLWLADRLSFLLTQHTTPSGKRIKSRSAYNLKLEPHIAALESSGKRAYAKEMESQRTIITDLLDGAQGFLHCTEHPFNQQCDVAIASAVDRIRQLHRDWSVVLSHSALLQSLGSLLSSAISKLIVDIEDMADISEPESQQLAHYCSRIAVIEELFTPQAQGTLDNATQAHEVVPLTAVYTPNWLKFQYLANILESSLVDIKYLWIEGELSLEYEKEELVDLIVALFADSPHRREAVGEIRRARR